MIEASEAFNDFGEKCVGCDKPFGMGRYPALRGGPADWMCEECAGVLFMEPPPRCADCGGPDVVVMSMSVSFCGTCLDVRFGKAAS